MAVLAVKGLCVLLALICAISALALGLEFLRGYFDERDHLAFVAGL